MGKHQFLADSRKKKNNILRFISSFITGIILFLATGMNHSSVSAQRASHWTPQQQIPNYDLNSRAPHMVADLNRTVHAFNYQSVEGDGMAITYREWAAERGWTNPVDIILPSPNAGVEPINDVYLDSSGIIHLLYFDSTIDGDSIYYTRAPAAEAGNAYAWSTPQPVGIRAGPVVSASMIGDSEGNLTVVYAGKTEGIGLYEVRSTDGGYTWSEPGKIFLARVENRWPFSIRLAYDQQGRLHAVWALVSDRGVGEGIYYARLEADGSQWSSPIELAKREGTDYSTHWPAIAVYNGEIFVVYQDSFPATLYMRQSRDYGETWSPAIRPWEHVGESENPILLIDSNNILHLVHANRIDEPFIGGMWHSVWMGSRWSEFEPVSVMGGSDPDVPAEAEASWFAPSAPQAVISQGNKLLITWWNNVGRELRTGAWSSYSLLDAPELTVVPLSTAIPSATPAFSGFDSTLEAAPTATRTPVYSGEAAHPSAGLGANNKVLPIIVGAIPVILLILMAFIFYAIHYRAR